MTATAALERRPAAAPESPYKGLVPFEDSKLDALLFFGREEERGVIVANLLASRLTVLYGPSGVGKSSLLRAGVAHELRRAGERNLDEHGHPELAVATFASWSGDPIAGIQEAAADALSRLFGTAALDPAGHEDELADVLETWTSSLSCELLLILDQAEEYFLYHEREAGPKTFAEQLPELVTRPGLRVGVLLAIRDDSLAKLDFFKGRIPSLFANYLRLDHLDRAAARRAITGPVERYNELAAVDERVAAEPALVDAVLDQVEAGKVVHTGRGRGAVRRQARATSRVEAPYLQLVMQRLWEVERARGSSVLRLGTLTELGGASRITEEHLERALASLSPLGRDVAALMFHHLVTPSGTKIAHRTADLAEYARVSADEVESVVQTLAGARILRPVDGRGNGSGAAHEIFHDVLGDAVVAWRTRHDTEQQVAQEREQARRRSRRFLAIVAVALAGLAAMTAVAVYAFAQRTEAREQATAARAAQLDALSQAREARIQRQKADRETAGAQLARRRATRSAAAERKAKREALSEAANAERALGEAEAARDDAEVARDEAEAARDDAEANAAAARAAEADADRQAAVAEAGRREARRQTRIAQRERRRTEAQAAIVRRQRLRARIGELTARSNALLDEDPEQSLTFAVQAARLASTPAVEDALRDALITIRLRAELRGGRAPVAGASFSRDGVQIAVATGTEVRLYRGRVPALAGVLRHPARVETAAFSDDGRTLISASRDGRARLWNTQTRVLLQTLTHPQRVTDAAIASGGRLAVTASSDGAARVWEVGTGLLVYTLRHAAPMRSLTVSPDGRFVVTVAAGDPVARVFNIETGAQIEELRQPGEVTDAAFSPTGDVVATAGTRNGFIWETRTWRRRHLLTGHTSSLTDVAFSANGRRVLTTSSDSSARLYDVATGEVVIVFTGHHQQRLNAGALSPDGQMVVTASNDGTARLSAPPLGARPFVLAGHGDRVTGVVFSSDGSRILTASDDGAARVWDATGDPQLQLLGRHDGAVASARFASDGRRVVSAGGDGTARIWTIGGGSTPVLRHEGAVTRAQFISGDRVLTASDDGTAVIWRATDGAALLRLPHGAALRAAAATTSRIVTAGSDGTAKLWTMTGRLTAMLPHAGPVVDAAFSGDGRLVATASVDDTARIWQSSDGRLLHTFRHEGDVTTLAFSPDGRVLASAGAATVASVWSVATGRRLSLSGHSDSVTSVSFSRDGRRVLTSSIDGDAREWTLNGRPVRIFRAHVSTVSQAAFSPDRRWVVTAGPSTAGLFQVRTGRWLFFIRGHTAPLRSASFSPDGRRIVTASADGSVRIYRCQLCARIPQLRAMANARLRQIARPDRPR